MNNDLMFSSKNQAWDTRPEPYDELNREFRFTLDPCCTPESCKCPQGFFGDEGQDGLKEEWFGRVFMNPPYGHGQALKWVRRATEQLHKCELIVGLLAARTDTIFYHRYIWDGLLHKPRPGVQVRFPKGRYTFGSDRYWAWVWEQEFIGLTKDGKPKKNSLYKKYGKKNPAPFPSMIVVWRAP